MLYDLMKLMIPIFLKSLFRCRVSGVENIPEEGGVIIASNHLSNWDPPVVGAYVPRNVYYMAKEELFEIPVFGYIIRKLGAFPVRRKASDRAAIRTAIQLLENGNCLGLFPEGTRSKDGELKKPEAGIALIALKADVPVVPTAIIGTNRIFSKGSFFPQVKIRYGVPFYMDKLQTDKGALQDFSQKIMDEIEKLIKEEKGI